MPFIEVKLWKGRSAQEKDELIEKLTEATVNTVKCPPRAVNVVIEEIDKENWGIAGKPACELFPD